MSRGLLTDAEREFLRGNREVDNPSEYLSNVRYRFRQRVEEVQTDLDILEAAGEEDIVEEFYHEFDRVSELEREIERLRSDDSESEEPDQ